VGCKALGMNVPSFLLGSAVSLTGLRFGKNDQIVPYQSHALFGEKTLSVGELCHAGHSRLDYVLNFFPQTGIFAT